MQRVCQRSVLDFAARPWGEIRHRREPPREVVASGLEAMCRSIRPLFNFEPPATDEEVRAAALQFVRKVSGSTKPSQRNAAAFERAVDEIAATTRHLLASLETSAPPKDRAVEAEKARARARKRFARG